MAHGMVQQLYREIRTTSYLLHPPLLDECGLGSALTSYVQGVVERSGLSIDLSIHDDFGRLPADMELAIFRIVQECLTNVHRYSGSKTASIQVDRRTESIRIEVRDGGNGISPERLEEIHSGGAGVGIRATRERVHHLHAEMRHESNSLGTSIAADIPVWTDVKLTAAHPLRADQSS